MAQATFDPTGEITNSGARIAKKNAGKSGSVMYAATDRATPTRPLQRSVPNTLAPAVITATDTSPQVSQTKMAAAVAL